MKDMETYFENRKAAEYVEYAPPEHGGIEARKIWTTTSMNGHIDFSRLSEDYQELMRGAKG